LFINLTKSIAIRKLELKELAAYLPYNLKGILTPQKDIVKFTGIVIDVYGSHEVQIDGEGVYALSRFKPILRPLSDLTTICEGSASFLEILEYECGGYRLNSNQFNADYLPYEVVKWLLKHRFDIFNLIPDNLAIDINTLNKE
jgi:hypothetical protein